MMTEQLTTLARPYARAAFEYALENHDLAGWENILANATKIVRDPLMIQLLTNPAITDHQLTTIFLELLAKDLDVGKTNFIKLLAENNRLIAFPEIWELFTHDRDEYEKTIAIQITSAINLDKVYQQKFIDVLTRRLKRKITLQCDVDESLMGGAIIRAGDSVIDGSIRGKLNRMLEFIE